MLYRLPPALQHASLPKVTLPLAGQTWWARLHHLTNQFQGQCLLPAPKLWGGAVYPTFCSFCLRARAHSASRATQQLLSLDCTLDHAALAHQQCQSHACSTVHHTSLLATELHAAYTPFCSGKRPARPASMAPMAAVQSVLWAARDPSSWRMSVLTAPILLAVSPTLSASRRAASCRMPSRYQGSAIAAGSCVGLCRLP